MTFPIRPAILPENKWPGLPKWPGVIVTGQSVTPEQAKEIIFRTDRSVAIPTEYMGNDHNFTALCIRNFGWEPLIHLQNVYYEMCEEGRTGLRTLLETINPDVGSVWEVFDLWRQEMNMISTEYATNDWLSSCYIGGPHGWCRPDGTINQQGDNWGKYPSVETVVQDWQNLVEAFPFLNVVVTLLDGEAHGETNWETNEVRESSPAVTIIVRDGTVTVHAPDMALHGQLPTGENTDAVQQLIEHIAADSYDYERGWPEGWVEEFAAKSKAAVDKIVPGINTFAHNFKKKSKK